MTGIEFTEALRLHNNTAEREQQNLQGLQAINDKLSLAIKNETLYNQLFPNKVYNEIDPAYRAEDFGKSRFDKRAQYLSDIMDPTDLRAREQNFFGRLGNDLVKTGIQTLTTAGNLFGLLAYGVTNGIIQSAKGDSFLNGVIDNPITNAMKAVDDWFEEKLPNYRSHEEQDTKWYKRAFTPGMAANFWFDDVMKNVGFSVGSMTAAKGVTTLVGKGLRLAQRKAYREAFETLGRTMTKPTASAQVKELIKQVADDGVLPTVKKQALDQLKKLSNREALTTELVGSALGAVGEAQFEANNALHDFKEKNYELLDQWMSNNQDHLATMYKKANGKDDQGKDISFEEFKQQKKVEAQADIDNQANRVANSVFGWETGLLTLTNYSTFRRFFSGGFRNFNSAAIKAGIDGGGDEIIGNIGRRITKNGTTEAFNKLTKAKKITNVVKPIITEGPVEEMGQNFINKASEFYHGSYLNEQLGYLLNPEYNNEAVNRINAIGKGLTNSYGNVDEWLDGFAGSIMGAFGLPNIHFNKKSEREKDKTLKPIQVSWDSGVYGEWKKIHETDKLVNEAVAAVNSHLQSPEKIKEFQHAISQIALDAKMTEAGLINDPLSFKDSEHVSLMKTIAAFKNARMEDMLDEYIDSASKDLTSEQIETIRQSLNEQDSQNLTDEQIRERIKHESVDMKRLVSSYREINDNLMRSYSKDLSNSEIELLSEMLSLADYKIERVTKAIQENKHLFPNIDLYEADGKTIKVDKAIEALSDILSLNDSTFDVLNAKNLDNKQILNDDQLEQLQKQHAQTVMSKLPNAWNQAKKEEVYHNLIDTYVNLKESIALNNEFAVHISNPDLMHHLSKQIFDEHLSEADKQFVQETVNKLINTNDADLIQQTLDNITNEDVKNKIIQHLKRDGNQFVKDYFQKEVEKKSWKQTLETYKYIADNLIEDANERQSLNDILTQLSEDDVENGINTIYNLLNDPNLTDLQRKIISELWSVWQISIPGKAIIKLEKQTELALKQLLDPQKAFVKTILPILQARNSNITISKIGMGLEIQKINDAKLYAFSDLQSHKTALRFYYKNGMQTSMIDYIIDNGTAINNTAKITLTDEQISELLTNVQQQLKNDNVEEQVILNIINQLDQQLINDHTFDAPLTQQDIDVTIQNKEAAELWNQYLHPETIEIQETIPTQQKSNNNTPTPQPAKPTTTNNDNGPLGLNGIESTRLQQIREWCKQIKADFDLITQMLMDDESDEELKLQNYLQPILNDWVSNFHTKEEAEDAKYNAFTILSSNDPDQTFYNKVYYYTVKTLLPKIRELSKQAQTGGTQEPISTTTPVTTQDYAITFPSEERWDNYRTPDQKHKSLGTEHIKKEIDHAIYNKLLSNGTFAYLNNGGLFQDGYLNYDNTNLKPIVFKNDSIDVAGSSKHIISIYAGRQLIGVLTSEHIMYSEIVKCGYNSQTLLYNCSTTLTRFAKGTLLYMTPENTPNGNRIMPLKQWNDSDSFSDYCDEVPMIFIDKKNVLHTNRAADQNKDLCAQLRLDIPKKKFNPGTIYIINQVGDAFAKEALLGTVNYVPFGISPMGWNQMKMLSNSQCFTKVMNLIDQLSKLTVQTPVSERNQLINNFKNLLIRNVRSDDAVYSEYAYDLNLVYNTNNNTAALKWESGQACIDKLELDIWDEVNSTISKEECAEKNLQAILNFFEKNDPILFIGDETFSKHSLISFNEMVSDGILSSALYQYNPINTTCYLDQTTFKKEAPQNIEPASVPGKPHGQSGNTTNPILEARSKIITAMKLQTWNEVMDFPVCNFAGKTWKIGDFTSFGKLKQYAIRNSKLNTIIDTFQNNFEIALQNPNDSNTNDSVNQDVSAQNNCIPF